MPELIADPDDLNAPIPLSQAKAIDLVRSILWPLALTERKRADRIDRWMRWDHDEPHRPRASTQEYKDLAARAQAPWGRRVVTAVCDQLYVEGFRASDEQDNAAPWDWWQANGWDARQMAIHEAAVGYGLAYAVVVPGTSWLGVKQPVMRGLDPSQMVAVYEDPAWDDWPVYAMRAMPTQIGSSQAFRLRLYEAYWRHNLVITASGDSVKYVDIERHKVPVCPVVRYTNRLDLRGRADGDVEPVIPLLSRIDQTTFDRLVVQRFASWKVRTATGMDIEESAKLAGLTPEQVKVRMQVGDILVGGPDTSFGTLDHTPLDGFIAAHDADVRALAAVSQTPAHELIGQMANLSAEALAAAEASLTRRVTRAKHAIGEAHEQTLRLSALCMDDPAAAADVKTEVHWRDMESRSLAQAADALGKIAQMLEVPVEVLWRKIPGWTQQDVDEAKAARKRGGGIDALVAKLFDDDEEPPAAA